MQNDSAFKCTGCGKTEYTTELASQLCVACAKPPKTEPAPGFDEIFAAYDEWYYGKFRNHPERMSADTFFQFLKKSNLIKETV